ASLEQSQGIRQVNTAVTQMDQVTQANAGTAEESASAAHELSAQAGGLRQAVDDLRKLVGGSLEPSGAVAKQQRSTSRVMRSARQGTAFNGRPAVDQRVYEDVT